MLNQDYTRKSYNAETIRNKDYHQLVWSEIKFRVNFLTDHWGDWLVKL